MTLYNNFLDQVQNSDIIPTQICPDIENSENDTEQIILSVH